MARYDGRANDELRPVEIVRGFLKNPEGSVLIRTGDTQVICTATVEEEVPSWLNGTGRGWVTAEYGMLPRATSERTDRYKVTGREHEIQRLIGRSLRAAVDLNQLGEREIRVDCDVIQADGGTRTASITGGFVALCDALDYMVSMGIITKVPVQGYVAAVSVGVVDGEVLLDLSYPEDSRATVDMNVVMRGEDFAEVQGTGENGVFNRETLDLMLSMARHGIGDLISKQRECRSE
ncbi:MAG: ribonuclease PH [Candidatus Thorarchaeota archaeon]|nr:MAG: ribonuclease PH [Candidatus Thorarchaeota archaeon]